ncbi:hypothetical protein C8R44DRAFT_850121 [Mycena epipterygia]|nr:hypothetical protein C8R44DRAFT_850121 [Mycena epipterygia]
MQLFEMREPTVRDCMRYGLQPSETERDAIRDSIAIARSRLSEVQSQESTPGDPLGLGLDSEEGSLRQYISEYSSLLAPIRLLPVDILRTILLDPDIHDYAKMEKKAPPSIVAVYKPNVVASVAHHWMDVVRGTSEFWTSFQISLGYRLPRRVLQRLRLCIERSKDAALAISFDWESQYTPFSPQQKDALNEILGHAERWAHVSLPMDPWFLSLLSPARGRLHQLETIAFTSGIRNPPEEDITVFQDAPNLRFLIWQGVSGIIPPLPWHQFRRAFLLNVDADVHCGKLLGRMTNLREVTINNSVNNRIPQPPSITPSPLLEMQKIVLFGFGDRPQVAMTVLNHINAPELKRVFLIHCPVWHSPSILSLVQRSGCHLQKLVLQDTGVRAPDLLALLRIIPTLDTLVMIQSIPNAVTNGLVEALTPSLKSTLVLPVLNTLVLTGVYLFSTDKFLTMLEGRTGPHSICHSLATIDITLPTREVVTPDRERFAALREVKSSTLVCLDESRVPVKIQFGEREDWSYAYDAVAYDHIFWTEWRSLTKAVVS